jgi:nucleotide-binding universal stress UspA family protein
MIALQRILCPTDFSSFSRRALEHATALARWYEADVTALYVHPLTLAAVPELPYVPPPLPLALEARRQLLARLGEFVTPARETGAVVEVQVLEGNPAAVIELEASEGAYDLIVMGTHGRRGFERLVLGSVAEKVVRRAACAVLTVGPTADDAAPAGVFRRILCPVDLLDGSAHTTRLALSLAQESGAQVTLLHVLDGRTYPVARSPFGLDVAHYRKEVEGFALEDLQRLVPEDARDWCRPEAVVTWGHPGREILAAAGERQADVIVMGAHGGALPPVVFGSTAQHVVRAAACPVLTVRDHARRPQESGAELVAAPGAGDKGEKR